MHATIREATTADIPQIQIVRNAVKENRLSDPGLVTDQDCEDFITRRGKGWVAVTEDRVIGFSIADLKEHNIWALFVDPDFEQLGIGSRLHDTMLNWYFSQTRQSVWLGTAPGTKAEKFYHKRGWKATGMHGKEIKFEMTGDRWRALREAAATDFMEET